jgi:hypothetical protein
MRSMAALSLISRSAQIPRCTNQSRGQRVNAVTVGCRSSVGLGGGSVRSRGSARRAPPLGQVVGRPSGRVGVSGGGRGGRRRFLHALGRCGRRVRHPPRSGAQIAPPNWRPGPRGRTASPPARGVQHEAPDRWKSVQIALRTRGHPRGPPQRHCGRQLRRLAVLDAQSGPPAAVRAPARPIRTPTAVPPLCPAVGHTKWDRRPGVPPQPAPTPNPAPHCHTESGHEGFDSHPQRSRHPRTYRLTFGTSLGT